MSRPRLSAGDLRQAFDEAFARPAASHREVHEDFLLVRLHDAPCAVRVAEVAGIQRCPPVAALPSRNSAVVGLAGTRGRLVVVYDLATLLGHGREVRPEGTILRCASDGSIALLFDASFGYVKVRPQDVCKAEASEPGVRPVEIVRVEGVNHTVISIREQLETIARTARSGPRNEES
jgi:chemotaxis signal transduction protein